MHQSQIHCQDPGDDSLSCYQTYRTTTAAAERLKAHARAAGISVSQLTRDRLDDLPPPKLAAPEINRVLAAEYSKLGSNLNQLVGHLNEQRLAGIEVAIEHARLISLIEKLLFVNKELRLELVGAGARK